MFGHEVSCKAKLCASMLAAVSSAGYGQGSKRMVRVDMEESTCSASRSHSNAWTRLTFPPFFHTFIHLLNRTWTSQLIALLEGTHQHWSDQKSKQ